MYSTPGISHSSFSIGLVTRSSTSRADAPGICDEDVDHRHDDLRLFFARQLPHREGAEQQRAGDHQRRQLGGDPGVGESPRRTETAPGAPLTAGPPRGRRPPGPAAPG